MAPIFACALVLCAMTDTVSVFDPAREEFRVIALPSQNIGIRKALVDGGGRYWYMGSHDGRLGVMQ